MSDREKDLSFERLQSRMEEVESLLSSGGGRAYDRSSSSHAPGFTHSVTDRANDAAAEVGPCAHVSVVYVGKSQSCMVSQAGSNWSGLEILWWTWQSRLRSVHVHASW